MYTTLTNRGSSNGDHSLGDKGVVVGTKAYVMDAGNGLKIYDFDSNTWSVGGTPPMSGDQAGVAYKDNDTLVGFAISTSASMSSAYTISGDTWDAGNVLAAPPTLRVRWATGDLEGNIYVIGGTTTGFNAGATTKVEIYSIADDDWSEGPSLPVSQFFNGTCVGINGRLWCWGEDASSNIVVLCYNPASRIWESVDTSTVPFGGFELGVALPMSDSLVLLNPGFEDDDFWLFNVVTREYVFAVARPAYLSDAVVAGASDADTSIAVVATSNDSGTASVTGSTVRSSEIPFMVGNDRYQTVWCVSQGAAGAAPVFRYWYAGVPPWGANLSGDTAYPTFFSFDENGIPVVASVELPVKPIKTPTEVIADRLLVEFVPRPGAITETGTTGYETLGFQGRVEGWGIPNYARNIDVGNNLPDVSGVAVSSEFGFSALVSTQASDTWPNVRAVELPLSFNQRIRAARIIFTNIHLVEIVRCHLLSTTIPSRNS